MSKRAVNLLRNMAVPFKRDSSNPVRGYDHVIVCTEAKTGGQEGSEIHL